MISDPSERPLRRRVYLVLSPKSLPYARYGLQTLLLNSLDALNIVLITDSVEDRNQLLEAIGDFSNPQGHSLRVTVKDELADIEAFTFRNHLNLRSFRHGHACWRKVTDPLLLSDAGAEMVILDPDLYFPNKFRFERTPLQGLLLMWQKPNCLLPPGVVMAAIKSGIPLARHVDIGVAHWRAPADLDWLDWVLGRLGGSSLPQIMHVEAIVWAALAMHEGGGYLDPRYWKCWQRTPLKRIMRKAGFSGKALLRLEPWSRLKCFHAGGEVKWSLAEVEREGGKHETAEHADSGTVHPFTEFTSDRYVREEAYKRLLRRLDYYEVFR